MKDKSILLIIFVILLMTTVSTIGWHAIQKEKSADQVQLIAQEQELKDTDIESWESVATENPTIPMDIHSYSLPTEFGTPDGQYIFDERIELEGRTIVIIRRENVTNELDFYQSQILAMEIPSFSKVFIPNPVKLHYFMNWLYNSGFAIVKIEEKQ